MSKDISNRTDVLDTCDIQERIDELADTGAAWERDANGEYRLDHDSYDLVVRSTGDSQWEAEIDGEISVENPESEDLRFPSLEAAQAAALDEAGIELDSDDQDELKALKALKAEVEDYCEWADGAALVRRSYWVDYCEELVSDIGDLPQNIPSYIVIDWEATANNLEADYTTVDFDGVEYLVRCS